MMGAPQESSEWHQLCETAAAQEGLFTTQRAAEAGYSAQPLVHHIVRGPILRVRRGIYRLVHFPAGEHEEPVTVRLWSEQARALSARAGAVAARAIRCATGEEASNPARRVADLDAGVPDVNSEQIDVEGASRMVNS
jgi:hypothetical protein